MGYRMDHKEIKLKLTKQDEMAAMQYLAKIMYEHHLINEMEKEEILKHNIGTLDSPS